MSRVALKSARARLGVVVVLAATGLAAPAIAQSGAARSAPARPTISVLSNRADLISGGDALVTVTLPPGTDPQKVEVRVGTRDVTGQFGLRENGQYEGLVTGLAVGINTLTASLPSGGTASQTIVNHASGGPLFAGPQVKP